MDIKEDNNYQEGYWSARSIVEHIEKTTYKDLDTAIGTKTELVKNFEDQFGFARDMKLSHTIIYKIKRRLSSLLFYFITFLKFAI